jgi:type VI secretion system secreted protein VgrG
MKRPVFVGATRELAALSEEQNNRLLRLDFPRGGKPAGAIMLANKLVADEAMSRDFRFEVEVLSDDARIPLKDMIGKMATVSLVREDGTLRHFNGYITEFRLIKADGGYAYYGMVLEPWLAFARLRKNSAIFQGRTVIEITEEIFKQYEERDWKQAIYHEYGPLACAIQYEETDHNHLHRRWEELGLHYWYEHRADGHTLWIGDMTQLAGPIEPGGNTEVPDEIPFRRNAGSGEADGIHEWQAVRRVASGSTTVGSFDYKRPLPLAETRGTRNQQPVVQPFEAYENTGGYAFATFGDGYKLAARRMEERDARAQFFEAHGNDRTVQPGRSFRLGGHFSGAPRPVRRHEPAKPDIDQRLYLILYATHKASNNYQAGRSAESQYECAFTCVRADIPWRPGRGFNSKPVVIAGVQTAIVVGPAGKNIYTDDFGRVKVQFHWDRQGKKDEASSAWVRVASVWAGNQLGFMALPRIGQEVAIQWVAGNPDHPLIIGRVFNRDNRPPWQLGDQQALSGLRSRELAPGDGNKASGRSNHLILDDTHGQIQVQLKSDHQHSQLSLGYITRIEDNRGRTDARGEGWELRTDGHGVARAAKGMLITTEAKQAAQGPVKDMDETSHRLALAAEQHDLLAQIAQKNGAQEAGSNQGDVAAVLQAQDKAITGAASGNGGFPGLAKPHLVLASPAGIATTTAGDTHIASDRHTAITTGKDLSFATGMSLFASIRHAFRLFVQKAGIKMVAATGDIDVQALSDNIKLLAKLEISHTANRITISAKEEVVINGGGSYAKISAGGIELGTNGTFVAHASSHSLVDAKNMEMAIKMPPTSDVSAKGHAVLHVGSHAEAAGKTSAGLPYKLFKEGGLVEQGQVDDKGNIQFAHDLDAKATYKVELPTGQVFEIAPTAYAEQHEINAGVGYHGYENPGGFLSEEAVSLHQDRIDSNPLTGGGD